MPGKPTQFLSLDEAIAIHDRVLAEFGGLAGVRDLGLLESALYRPRSGYYEDLVSMAAALFESLLMNHPFVDGNKRVAFFATDTFLRINGCWLEVDADAAHGHLIGLLEQGEAEKEKLADWISTHLRQRHGPRSSR